MRINNNLMAMNTHRQLGINANNGSKSIEKLSSGYRINRAGDDAAGLAISEKMRGQIRGLGQASRNSQDAISLVQTAEGALNETQAILQRMRELAVQSATDTNTTEDRSNLQDELTQLTKEIDRISDSTQFNTKNLLDGTMGSAVNTAVNNISSNNVLRATNATTAIATTTALTALLDSNGNSLGIAATDTVSISYVKNGTTVENTFTAGALTVAALGTTNGAAANTDLAVAMDATTLTQLNVTAATAGFEGAINGLTITIKDSSGDIKTSATNAVSAFAETTAAANVQTDGRATFQIGANTDQNIQLDISNMSSGALGIKDIKIATQSQANVAINVIDSANQKVSAQRSSLGAVQNRLEHTIKNLDTSAENLQASESRIRDVDMAKEMMEFTKNNILQQAAQAMLAQANQAPQGVLQLLR